MTYRKELALGLLLGVFFIFALSRNSEAVEDSIEDIPLVLAQHLINTMPQEQYVFMVLGRLRQADLQGDGLDRQDIDMREAELLAAERANAVRSYLLHDLDGDGRLTRQEAEDSNRLRHRIAVTGDPNPQVAKNIERAVNQLMAADSNQDGSVTFREMVDGGSAAQHQRSTQTLQALNDLLALDPNEDGRLTAKELNGLALEVFGRVDADGDGLLSATELKPLQDSLRTRAVAARHTAGCVLPKAAAEDMIVLFGTYEGHGISTASVAGMDQVTSTGTIHIEKGTRPLYILLTSYDAMVWQFAGHTERVARVVVLPRRSREGPGAGVTGLPAGRVTIAESGTCFPYFHDVKSSKALQATATIERYLERPVDVTAGIYGMWNVHLPSARTAAADAGNSPPPKGVPRELWRELKRFSPGGVVEIDAKAVIAPSPAQPYDVLPQQAGLVQLVQQGALRQLSDGAFHIVAPIARFPAGLAGAHSVKFVLGKGVPMPGGSPAHSCVVSEEDGTQIANSGLCR